MDAGAPAPPLKKCTRAILSAFTGRDSVASPLPMGTYGRSMSAPQSVESSSGVTAASLEGEIGPCKAGRDFLNPS